MSTVLFAIVLLVLIIAAVNVANLLLGRAAVRAKEIAIRVSVGASRWRLVRQLLTESLLLALLGGVGGLILAQWAIWSLRAIPLPTDLPIVIDVRLDHRVALYGAALALITGYFETMGTPIVRGRAIDARDDSRAPKVAVVNETMATRFWPGRDAVGQRFTLVGDRPESIEVIGVARNAKYFNAVEPPALSYFYLPYRQHRQETMTLRVRASNGDALALLPAVRREVQALAPDLPMFDVRRMRDVFEGKGLLAARLMAQMVGVIALIGATLALVGLYAVIAFVVTHRTREIGIRMALGATRASVAGMTLGWGLKAAGAGIIVGAALALSLSNLLGTMIGSVSPHDPLVFTVVLSALLAAVIASSWLPARRAASIAPTTALRQE